MRENDAFELPPVVRTVEVGCDVSRAFALFTGEIHLWWPVRSHSLAGADCVHVEIEPREGGRVFERDRQGKQHDWGLVLAWSPPHRVRFTWRVGQAAASRQEVEVQFAPAPAGGTRVTVTHSGWSHGEEAARERYHHGWALVLENLNPPRAAPPA